MSDNIELAPLDTKITMEELTRDPYPIYKKLRAESPVIRVDSIKRTFVTKAVDCKYVKDNPLLFSSNDPNTPMKPAFQGQTLMRKDGEEHMAERMAMQPSLMPKTIQTNWALLYRDIAEEYVSRLPRGETVDLFTDLAGPVAARILAHILGIPNASDEEMQRWSQDLIDASGNFQWEPEPFERTDKSNAEMNALFESVEQQHISEPNQSVYSVMLNAENPIPKSQMYTNIKIAIGGGINEPRDALSTIIFGLLTNPDQLEEIKRIEKWGPSFEEGVRWVAPIQASSRMATEDVEIRGCLIPKGDTVMTIQASASHDEELFDHPEKYDAFRPKNPHQAFGSGPHHCAGTHVARRTVGQIMLPVLFDRFPNLQLTNPDDVIWSGFGFRGPLNLPVILN